MEKKFYSQARLLLMFSLISVAACAQKTQDVLYLKDGSILKGTITLQIPDSVVMLELEGGSILAVKSSSIASIEREKISVSANSSIRVGYTNLTLMNVLSSYNGDGGASFSTVHGYRFRQRTMIGGGIGIAFASWTFIDLFAEVRQDILERKATPYLFGNAGIGIPLATYNNYDSNLHSGGMWAAGLGMRFFFRKSGSFTVAGGYRQNFFSEDYEDYWGNLVHTELSLNYVTISFGLAY